MKATVSQRAKYFQRKVGRRQLFALPRTRVDAVIRYFKRFNKGLAKRVTRIVHKDGSRASDG